MDEHEDLARRLAHILHRIELHDQDYTTRFYLLLDAVAVAHRCGYDAGFRIDPKEPEWPVVFISLPTGQASWHIPQYPKEWDGHSTEDKYTRVHQFMSQQGLRYE